MLDRIGEGEAADVLRAMIQRARDGDVQAGSLLLSRCWPPRRGRPVTIGLPAIGSAADLPAALSCVVRAVCAGRLTPDEGSALASLLDAQRRVIETADLEERVAVLEAKQNGSRN